MRYQILLNMRFRLHIHGKLFSSYYRNANFYLPNILLPMTLAPFLYPFLMFLNFLIFRNDHLIFVLFLNILEKILKHTFRLIHFILISLNLICLWYLNPFLKVLRKWWGIALPLYCFIKYVHIIEVIVTSW